MISTTRTMRRKWPEALGYASLMAASLVLGLFKVESTGALWPDSPRYANAGAMIHDWLASGAPANIYWFAQRNYARYPAFNMPFHPPAYPSMLGGLFLVTGVSYFAARALVAACLGVSAVMIALILRRLGTGPVVAIGCALLWLTTPEAVRWSRDTMSEVPSLAMMLAATWVFLSWLESPKPRPWQIWSAFALAGLAFFSRVTTVGILPSWFFFAAATGRYRRLISPHIALGLLLYLGVSAGYVRFAGTFSRHEVTADGKGQGPTLENLANFATCLPEAMIWGTSALAAVGFMVAIGFRKQSRPLTFGFCWLAAYTCFKLAMPTSPEIRHIFGALPALAILSACLWNDRLPFAVRKGLAPTLLLLAVSVNLYQDDHLTRGVVGYDEVARLLAEQERPGNVLLACPEDQDLIFRYRTSTTDSSRAMVRADRTLAIRVSDYAKVEPRIIAHRADDLLRVVREGRIRYLVTAVPGRWGTDRWTEEMALAHSTAMSNPAEFRRIAEIPLLVQYSRPGRSLQVVIWEYLGELPSGPSTLQVVIPTAGMTLDGGQ